MYFIELIFNKLKKKKNQSTYETFDEQEPTPCEHIFMPIDSTGEILSCRNCGLVVNRKDLKDINFFRHKN